MVALDVSKDGRKIVAEMRDNAGAVIVPLLYTLDDEGKWSYSEICPQLINPEHIVVPEDPGEGPMEPSPETYMTQEEIDEYTEAIMAFYNGDRDTWPEYEEFMTEEEIEAYNKAVDEYNAVAEVWNEKFEAFYGAYSRILETSHCPVYNKLYISPDGKYAVSTTTVLVEREEPDWMGNMYDEMNAPLLYNLEDGSYKLYEKYTNYNVTSFDKDYNIYCRATVGSWYEPPMYESAYVCPAAGDEFISLEKYVAPVNSELGAWIKENMYHEYVEYDEESGEFSSKNIAYTGYPYASADGSMLACCTQVGWEDDTLDEDVWMISYALPLFDNSGVRSIGNATFSLRSERGGRIILSGDVKDVTVYDLNGRVVFRGVPVSNVVETGLGTGVYVVRALDASGEVKSIKAVL